MIVVPTDIVASLVNTPTVTNALVVLGVALVIFFVYKLFRWLDDVFATCF